MSITTIQKLFKDYEASPYEVLNTFCRGYLALYASTRVIITFLKFRYEDAVQDLTILTMGGSEEALKNATRLVEALKLTLLQLHYRIYDYDGMANWINSSNLKLREELSTELRVNIEHLIGMMKVMRPTIVSSKPLEMSIPLDLTLTI
jgi:hypothetical protein